jgi:signal transduction histidine kinase
MDHTIVYRRILEIFGIIGAVLLFAFILSSFWITRLKKEISLRKKAEAELKRLKEEAELANAYKSSFLARMSHEIRTPLNAITGMTYLLGKSQVNSSQRLYLDKISQSSRSMLGIINDILDFSKIEAGKIEIEKVSFNLDILLEQVVNIISYRVEEQDLDFSINKSPDVPTYFIGDPLRIQQIITNITNNAIKFTKEGSVNIS